MPPFPVPLSRCMEENGRRFELRVEQQPQRARMCGFGDKDRRPITPPPCVRLVITDLKTKAEVDVNSIEHSMYVLNVDLWDESAFREVNLVSHSASSPAISASIPTSYAEGHASSLAAHSYGSQILPPAVGSQQSAGQYAQVSYNGVYNPYPGPPHVNAYSQHTQSSPHYPPQQPQYPPPAPQYNNGYGPPNGGHNYPPANGYGPPGGAPHYPQSQTVQSDRALEYIPNGEVAPRNHSSLLSYNGASRSDLNVARTPISSTPPSGMYTRNLIGSLAASAFRLTDVNERIGIWFVLQDLSVRTEGTFRLRFSFVNVGTPSRAADGTLANITNSIVNTGRAPVLAQCFSDVFTVYSAKRFPGVVESTPLSKCFATQGIKIPIRKDAQNNSRAANGANGANGRDDDEDEAY